MELPSRFEPDLILTMNALLSKNFALLRHAAPLRCSRISYAPLLGPRLPCIARFLLRRLCLAERLTLRIEVSICTRARSSKKKYLRTFVGGISFWSSHPDSNWRPHPYHGCALPTELWEQLLSFDGAVNFPYRLIHGWNPSGFDS